jgi:hypothetical protein
MITYEKRVAKMKKVGDEHHQLQLAKAYAKRMRSNAKKGATLAEKIKLQGIADQAEGVVRNLRLNSFELEDMLRAKANGALA